MKSEERKDANVEIQSTVKVVTSKDDVRLAARIRSASQEILQKNAHLYKELENK